MAPGFAIIGTGGCGTAYMAAVMVANGIRCGHERWWTPIPACRRFGLDGDSSWLAVPDIETGVWSGPVLHITRDPVSVVRNLIGGGIFAQLPSFPQYREFALRHEPEIADLPAIQQAVEWWARWNERCAKVADITMPITEVPERLDEIGDLIGYKLAPDLTQLVPSNTNHRHRATVDESAIWWLLDGRAESFGYREG